MRGLNHPNVVEMKDVVETMQHMFIIMEIVEGGELFDQINDFVITEKEAALVTH